MSKYLPNPKPSGGNVKAELDLSNYTTKSDLEKCKRCWYIIFC